MGVRTVVRGVLIRGRQSKLQSVAGVLGNRGRVSCSQLSSAPGTEPGPRKVLYKCGYCYNCQQAIKEMMNKAYLVKSYVEASKECGGNLTKTLTERTFVWSRIGGEGMRLRCILHISVLFEFGMSLYNFYD